MSPPLARPAGTALITTRSHEAHSAAALAVIRIKSCRAMLSLSALKLRLELPSILDGAGH
jgi:hypothetical protein